MPRHIVNLNGTWAIRFDPSDRGKEQRWFADETFAGDAGPEV